MKTLILIRHAKSSWANIGQADFDRPLNDRGKTDAPVMAQRLHEKIAHIDAFISSPARRTLKTAKRFLAAYQIPEKELIQQPDLYEAPYQRYYSVIENLNDNVSCVAIIGHNPGITDFINSLGAFPVYNMPTCGVYASEIDIAKWALLQTVTPKLLFFDYPKKEMDQ